MKRTWELNLRMFEGGAGAAGAAAGGTEGGSAEGSQGENGITILEDGTQVDRRLAERMEKQQRRRKGAQGNGIATGNQGDETPAENAQQPQRPQTRQAQQQNQQNQNTQKTPDQEFDELIRGKYAQQYQQRFQAAINDRFKNQADLQGQLDGLKPMLDALAKQHGIEAGDYNALSSAILDDDSLYEDEAEAAGMTVEAYKSYQKLKQHADEMEQRELQAQKEMGFRNHFQKLAQQGEEMKQMFPEFDLMKELNNTKFRRLTAPEVGLSVKDAYFAIHHDELAPQAMAAGVQIAQQRISQTLQANGKRPVEGAMQGAVAADIHMNPKAWSREEREALKARARRGEEIIL